MNDRKVNPLLMKKCNHGVKRGDRRSYALNNEPQYCNADDGWWSEEFGTSSSSSESSHLGHRGKEEWETHVTPRGDLFFCERYPQKKNNHQRFCYPFTSSRAESSLDKDNSSGSLVHLIRRRSNRRSFRRKDEEDIKQSKSQTKFATKRPFHSTKTYMQSSDFHEVTVQVDPENSFNLGRRATLLENILGLVTTTDGSRIVVSGFITNFNKIYKGSIKLGDCIHSIDGRIATPENINSSLSNITSAREVVLKIQSVGKCTRQLPVISGQTASKTQGQSALKGGGLTVMYAKLESISEGGPPGQGIVYAYPNVNSSLTTICGACLTLHQLLPEIASAHPISTTIKIKEKIFHVLYTHEGKEVLMISLSNDRYTLKEAIRVNADIVKCLRFTYQSLSRCFCLDENKEYLDEFFKNVVFRMQVGLMIDNSNFACSFEELLPVSHWLPLPKEAQMHIDDALNELEANDIWAYESQRLYSVIGSCFFHKGYMVCSHLSKDDLMDVTSLCRQGNLLNLCNDGVKKLIFWKEVYPASCQRGLASFSTQPYSTPLGRWFLLIVAQDHDMVAVLLESGGCTARFDGNQGPDAHYVEETQATLDHIHKIGIPRFMKKWLEINKRHEGFTSGVCNKDNVPETGTLNRNSETSRSSQNVSIKRAPDLYPLTKHRSNLELQTPGFYDTLNGSSSLAGNGPVLGRRAERERAIDGSSQSRISESEVSDDSDWFKDKKSLNGSGVFDLSDFGKNLLDTNVTPSRITAGSENVLFHYVHLDNSEGVLLSCIGTDSELGNLAHIIHNFRLHAHHIHNILMNTVSFKKLKIQEISSNVINKSLAAIKEHGLLFVHKNEVEDKVEYTPYWIIGRLFFVPQPKEVYVCYQDSCPQNMVEVAFCLALNTSV